MKEYAFGLDLGGTTCKVGLFKTDGTLIEKWEVPTDTSNGGENILKNLAEAVHAKMNELGITADLVEGVGIGVPGPVTPDGIVNKCVNLGWGRFSIEKDFSELLQLPVKAGNDANVAALGEYWKGAGVGYDDMVMVTLGTGIGGGIILNGKMLAGVNGAAGEIGHIIVDKKETDVCGCGRRGCIEQYASATGVVRIAKRHLEAKDTPSTLRDIDLDKLEARHVFDAAKAGDELAEGIAKEACELLGHAMSSISCVVDPQAFVIGGGVSKAGQYLIDLVEKEYKNYAFHAHQGAKILTAKLGNDAGMYGSVKMVIDRE